MNVIIFTSADLETVALNKLILPLSEIEGLKVFVINRPADLVLDPFRWFRRFRRKLSGVGAQYGRAKMFTPVVFFSEVISEQLFSKCNVNMALMSLQVKRLIKRYNINHKELVLCSYTQFHWKLFKEIPAFKKVYIVDDEYCYDPEDNFLNKASLAERVMIQYSDEIVCASEMLYEKFQKITPKPKCIHLISTPADERSFCKRPLHNYSPWDKISDPKLVILGTIRDQTNLTLIGMLAEKIPNVSIVFIGRDDTKCFDGVMKKHRNIFHLGFLSQTETNYCLSLAKIGLYPAKKCRFSLYANSNRIYEYAANGLPIVGININRESDFPSTIIVAKDDEEFVAAVEHFLNNGVTDSEKLTLVEFAKKHSANEIAKKLLDVFQETNK